MNDTKRSVTLVSSRTRDHLPALGAEPARTMPGGPAHYVGAALSRLGMPFRLITGDIVDVQVVPGRAGEQEYVIPAIPRIELPTVLEGNAVIFSPIMREIDPVALPGCAGILAIDVQGFVRVPGVPSAHPNRKFDLAALFRRAAIVKAGEEELALLTDASREALRDLTLLQTLGSRGAVIRQGSRETLVPAEPVPVRHTIGAGDTFLAGFVVATLNGQDAIHAAEFAARFTEGVLRERAALAMEN